MQVPKDIEEAAKICAGNHRKFDSFGWHDRPEDDENWMIYYTSNRDSQLIDQANEFVINKEMRPFTDGDEPDVVFERHSHWACGYVDGFSIRVYRNGKITPAFEKLHGIMLSLANYPVLDDDKYSEMQYEAENECIEQHLNYLKRRHNVDISVDDSVGKIWGWLSDNNKYFEDGYIDDREIEEAAYELGILKDEQVSD